MTTELLRPRYSNISCTEDQCAFSCAVMSTELEVSIEEQKTKLRVLKILQLFFLNFRKREREIITQYKGSAFHTFQVVTSQRNTC